MTDLDLTVSDLTAYEQEFDSPLRISAAAADLLFREAATGYRFSDEPVTDEQVRAVHDLTKWGPTAMNSQPLRIVLVRSARGPRASGGAHGRRQQGAHRSGPAGRPAGR